MNAYGFQLTVLFHAAVISLTILSALSFKPIQYTVTEDFGKSKAGNVEEECKRKETNLKAIPEKKDSKLICANIWIPNINEIFMLFFLPYANFCWFENIEIL